jgi:hypothetical protein
MTGPETPAPIDWRQHPALTRNESLIVAKATAHQELTRNGRLAAILTMLARAVELDGTTPAIEEKRAESVLLLGRLASAEAIGQWIDSFR